MTTDLQETGLAPGEREVDYADVAAGMRFLCGILRGGHEHEIVKVKASVDDPNLERVADLVSGGVIGPVRR